jgi:hypothetical protein
VITAALPHLQILSPPQNNELAWSRRLHEPPWKPPRRLAFGGLRSAGYLQAGQPGRMTSVDPRPVWCVAKTDSSLKRRLKRTEDQAELNESCCAALLDGKSTRTTVGTRHQDGGVGIGPPA